MTVTQTALLRAAFADGACGTPVELLEAHGTGTPLGDPTETSSFAAAVAGGAVVPATPTALPMAVSLAAAATVASRTAAPVIICPQPEVVPSMCCVRAPVLGPGDV